MITDKLFSFCVFFFKLGVGIFTSGSGGAFELLLVYRRYFIDFSGEERLVGFYFRSGGFEI